MSTRTTGNIHRRDWMVLDLSSFNNVEKMNDKELRESVRLLLIMTNRAFEQIDWLAERINDLEKSREEKRGVN